MMMGRRIIVFKHIEEFTEQAVRLSNSQTSLFVEIIKRMDRLSYRLKFVEENSESIIARLERIEDILGE